ncbi:hypothetical protein B6S12_09400 [Helicobacter valdiviensis]|uniref:Uncharacterized protein n=1 Tax=Helicobacter valdiviensis TaxID=1458358 RepID=A0A2W6NJ41_9HELI|nr:hypothetical protein [Helicobacter valdiviensis]PZT47376.1 hypothetical protein B6S12_09400 [Helicobacter valdiviensis]
MLVRDSGINSVINEANRLLGDHKEVQSVSPLKKKEEIKEQAQEDLKQERVTYGMLSLELMSDEQYRAFERVTASMSPNEKIAVAQTLTRAGNLSASVERVEAKEKELEKKTEGLLGISQEGWGDIALEFQDNLNNLQGIYTKAYNKNLSSNYNDILRHTGEAKTQRLLREFSHAIHIGNTQIDTIS